MSHSIDGSLLSLGAAPLDTVHGPFQVHVLHDLSTATPVLAVTLGDVRGPAPLLARLHSSCITSEVYGGCDCDCVEQLDAALAHIARAGRGAVFYLSQEGRGAGLIAKARDRMMVQASGNRLTTFDAYAAMGLAPDQRRYGAVTAACRLLGIAAPLRLLTGNPEKAAALRADGLCIEGTCALGAAPSPFNGHYLAAKARAGHTVAGPLAADPAAALPEPVACFEPHALPDAPRFIRLASYLLPLRLEPPAWFRLHAYFDLAAGRERVVLTHGRPGADVMPLVRLQGETLLERFPVREPHQRRRWMAAAARIVAHGAGCALFTSGPHDALDAGLHRLLATHVPGGAARRLVDGGAASDVVPGDVVVLSAVS